MKHSAKAIMKMNSNAIGTNIEILITTIILSIDTVTASNQINQKLI